MARILSKSCEHAAHYVQMSDVDPQAEVHDQPLSGVQSNDVIKNNAIFPLRPNNTSALGYSLSTARPRAPTPCNWNILFAKLIPTVVVCIRASPVVLTMSVRCALDSTHLGSCEAHVERRLGPFHSHKVLR